METFKQIIAFTLLIIFDISAENSLESIRYRNYNSIREILYNRRNNQILRNSENSSGWNGLSGGIGIPSSTKEELLELPIDLGTTKVVEFCETTNGNLRRLTSNLRLDRVEIKIILGEGAEVAFYPEFADRLLQSPYFHHGRNITIFLTGWSTQVGDTRDPVYQLAMAYKCRETHNFLILDTGAKIDDLLKWSTYDYENIGKGLNDALLPFIQQIGVSKIHLIGHGVGAHIAGIIGRHFYNSTGDLLPRITGLDPANSCLYNRRLYLGLQKGDAEFVDVIHTNHLILGSSCTNGDVDIFVSSFTTRQLGCTNVVCEHYRAIEYFTESVVPNGGYNFRACKSFSMLDVRRNRCAGPKIPFGLHIPKDVKGNYFFIDYSLPSFGIDASRCISLR